MDWGPWDLTWGRPPPAPALASGTRGGSGFRAELWHWLCHLCSGTDKGPAETGGQLLCEHRGDELWNVPEATRAPWWPLRKIHCSGAVCAVVCLGQRPVGGVGWLGAPARQGGRPGVAGVAPCGARGGRPAFLVSSLCRGLTSEVRQQRTEGREGGGVVGAAPSLPEWWQLPRG